MSFSLRPGVAGGRGPLLPRGASIGLAALLAITPGCQSEASPTPKPQEVREPQHASPGRDAVRRDASWPGDEQVDRAARARLTEEAARAVSGSVVPVLVPPASAHLAKVVTGENFTAVSISDAGATIAIQASPLAFRYEGLPKIEGKETLRGIRGFVTQNEAIWTASWNEFGVAYSVDVECASAEDARCKDDAYLRALVEALAYVGGKEAAR